MLIEKGEEDVKTKNAPVLLIFLLTFIAIAANLNTTISGILHYYLNGVVGFGVVIAGSFVTIFRIWDAVTDVVVGSVVDRTRTKFGRFSPYMLAGAIGAAVSGIAMINVPVMLPEGAVRKVGFVILYMLYVVFTTMEVSGFRSTA